MKRLRLDATPSPPPLPPLPHYHQQQQQYQSGGNSGLGQEEVDFATVFDDGPPFVPNLLQPPSLSAAAAADEGGMPTLELPSAALEEEEGRLRGRVSQETSATILEGQEEALKGRKIELRGATAGAAAAGGEEGEAAAAAAAAAAVVPAIAAEHSFSSILPCDSPLRFEHLSPFLVTAPAAMGGGEGGQGGGGGEGGGGGHYPPPPGSTNQASPQLRPMPGPPSLDEHPFSFSDAPFLSEEASNGGGGGGSGGSGGEVSNGEWPQHQPDLQAMMVGGASGEQQQKHHQHQLQQQQQQQHLDSSFLSMVSPIWRDTSNSSVQSGGRGREGGREGGEGVAFTRRTSSMDESHRQAAAVGVGGGPVSISVRKGSFSSHRSSKSLLVREDKHGHFLGGAGGNGGVEGGWGGYGAGLDDFDWDEARIAIGGLSPPRERRPPLPPAVGGAGGAAGGGGGLLPTLSSSSTSSSTSFGGVGSTSGGGGGLEGSFDEMAGVIAASSIFQQQEQQQQQQSYHSTVFPTPPSLSPTRRASLGTSCSSGYVLPPPAEQELPFPPSSQPPPIPPPEPPSSFTAAAPVASAAAVAPAEEADEDGWARIGADFQAVLPDLLLGEEERKEGEGEGEDEEEEGQEDGERPTQFSSAGSSTSTSSEEHQQQQQQQQHSSSRRRSRQEEQRATLVWSPSWGKGSLERVVAVTGGGRVAALQEWTPEEVAAFEKGVQAYRRCFSFIHRKCLPSKSVKAIVARFYDEFKRSEGYRAWKGDKLVGRRLVLRQKRPRWKGGGWEEVKGTIRGSVRDEEGDELLDLDYDDGRVGQLYRYEAEPLLLGPGDEEGGREGGGKEEVKQEPLSWTSQEEGASLATSLSLAGERMDHSGGGEDGKEAREGDGEGGGVGGREAREGQAEA